MIGSGEESKINTRGKKGGMRKREGGGEKPAIKTRDKQARRDEEMRGGGGAGVGLQ